MPFMILHNGFDERKIVVPVRKVMVRALRNNIGSYPAK